MKAIRILLVALVAVMATACSESYSPDKCKALAEKIQSDDELSQSDYADMISQLNCILDDVVDKGNAINEADSANRVEMALEMRNDPQLRDQMGYLIGFSIILGQAKRADKLDAANVKNYDNLEKRGEELRELGL